MRRREVEIILEQHDLLEDIKPEELAKEAKLGWLKRLLIIAVWPIIKPFIAKKVGSKVADIIGNLLEEI